MWSRKEMEFLQEAQHGPMGAQTRLCRLGQVSAILSPLGLRWASHVPLCSVFAKPGLLFVNN